MAATIAAVALAALAPAAQAGQTVDRIAAGDRVTPIGFGEPPATFQDTAGTGEGLLDQPRGIAINDPGIADGSTDPQGASTDGYLYVVEGASLGEGNNRIQVFDSEGNFRFMFGRGVLTGGDGGEVCDATQTPCGNPSPEADDGAGEFDGPVGIALDQATGDVYVNDLRNRRIQHFAADGSFIRAWGWGVDNGANEFQLCEAPEDLPCQAGNSGANGGQLHFFHVAAGAIVADPSPPHHVFVGDAGNQRIQEFAPDGSFVRLWGWDVVPAGQPGDRGEGDVLEICESSAAGACQAGRQLATDESLEGRQPSHLALDAGGVLYANSRSVSGAALLRFDTNAAAPASLLMAPVFRDRDGAPPQGFTGTDGSAQAMAIDPGSGNLLVVGRRDGEGFIQELDTAVEPPVEVDRHVVGNTGLGGDFMSMKAIAADPASGEIHFSGDSGNTGHRVLAADADGAPPALMAIDDPSATVDEDKATFSGTITPGGPPGFNTFYAFQYSRDGKEWLSTPERSLGDTGEAVAVEEQVSGLEPNSLYRVRLATRKSFANPEALSGEVSFTSDAIPPTVQTAHPAARADTSAVLVGRINPNNSPTAYRFEWGPDPGPPYPNSAPVPDGDAGADFGSKPIVQEVTGLKPNTTYRYRLVADNGVEEAPGDTLVEGEERSFTTRAALPTPPGRGYELVSPAEKIGGAGVGEWYVGLGSIANSGRAAQIGERFAANGTVGSMLLDGAHTYINDTALAERVDGRTGWVSHSPLTHPGCAIEATRSLAIQAAAPDLSLATWNSNGGTVHMGMPGAEDTLCTWNEGTEVSNPSYISDWQGRWELFGPTDLEQVPTASAAGTATAVAAGGGHVLGTSGMRGLAGPEDPTHPDWPDLTAGQTVYLDDVSAGLSDSYPGAGIRELVQVCAGGTELPVVAGSGKLAAEECAPPGPGRSHSLVSRRGAVGAAGEGAISANGSRTFFLAPDPGAEGVPSGVAEVPSPAGQFCDSAGETCPPQLFVRQRNPDGSVVTRWISRAENGLFGEQAATLTGTVRFEGATPDGKTVFFRTNSPLSEDDPNGTGAPVPGGVKTGSASSLSWDLYAYELADGPDPTDGGTLTRITAGPDGDGDCNRPQNPPANSAILRFASEDGSRAYFVCAAPLGGVEGGPAGNLSEPGGEPATADRANLYLYDAKLPVAQRWRFVARLPATIDDGPAACATAGSTPTAQIQPSGQHSGLPLTSTSSSCVRGTADGEFLSFWTPGRLTADDPDEASMDIYAFDAAEDELVRVTAPRGGAGGSYECITEGAHTGLRCFGDLGFDRAGTGIASKPLVPGDRIVFFQSRSRLVAADEDDAYDVYEWRNGTLSLLSSGKSDSDGAFFKGNERNGRNAYFATRDQYSWQDFDAVADVYTARVGGGIPEPPPPPACAVLVGACRGAGSAAPPGASPASAVFQGPGNIAPAGQPRNRCAKLSRRARKLAGKAKRLRRSARRAARRGQGRRVRRLKPKVRRSARKARRAVRGTKRCRRAARAGTDKRRSR
ncbi:MAG: hypothetical protein WDZ46_09735 [Solirubrobacterales bacterium]